MSDITATINRQAVRNPGDLSNPENLNAFVNNINQALFNLAKRPGQILIEPTLYGHVASAGGAAPAVQFGSGWTTAGGGDTLTITGNDHICQVEFTAGSPAGSVMGDWFYIDFAAPYPTVPRVQCTLVAGDPPDDFAAGTFVFVAQVTTTRISFRMQNAGGPVSVPDGNVYAFDFLIYLQK